jgi:hypothetical protein
LLSITQVFSQSGWAASSGKYERELPYPIIFGDPTKNLTKNTELMKVCQTFITTDVSPSACFSFLFSCLNFLWIGQRAHKKNGIPLKNFLDNKTKILPLFQQIRDTRSMIGVNECFDPDNQCRLLLKNMLKSLVHDPKYPVHSKDALHYFIYKYRCKKKLLTNIWYISPDICSGKILLRVKIT